MHARTPYEYVARMYAQRRKRALAHDVRVPPIGGEGGSWSESLAFTETSRTRPAPKMKCTNYSQQLIHARDAERRHMARELHESAGQTLAALKMNLARLEEELPADCETGRDLIRIFPRAGGCSGARGAYHLLPDASSHAGRSRFEFGFAMVCARIFGAKQDSSGRGNRGRLRAPVAGNRDHYFSRGAGGAYQRASLFRQPNGFHSVDGGTENPFTLRSGRRMWHPSPTDASGQDQRFSQESELPAMRERIKRSGRNVSDRKLSRHEERPSERVLPLTRAREAATAKLRNPPEARTIPCHE